MLSWRDFLFLLWDAADALVRLLLELWIRRPRTEL